jgi:hypothetical protein
MADERGGEEPQLVYLDDAGQEQGPFPLSTLASWVQGGYFDAARQVRSVHATEFVSVAQVPELAQFLAPAIAEAQPDTAGGGPPEPRNDQEAMLSEYYKNYYEQAFAKARSEYEEQLRAHEMAAAVATGKPPEDGYVVPKPQFEEYAVTGKFAKIHGRFMAEGQGGSEYWAAKGTQVSRLCFCFSWLHLFPYSHSVIARDASWTTTTTLRRSAMQWRPEWWRRTRPTRKRRSRKRPRRYRSGWRRTRWRGPSNEQCAFSQKRQIEI